MLVKNQIYEAEITDYTAEGQGVAHIEGCAVFIPNAVAGEKVRVRVEKAQKTWAAGKIVEILEKSPHRVNRECEVAKLCGGCDFWHMDYAEETRLKAERVKNCLNRIGGENLAEVPILAAPDCHGYRNKAQYPVAVKGFFHLTVMLQQANVVCHAVAALGDPHGDGLRSGRKRSGRSCRDENF